MEIFNTDEVKKEGEVNLDELFGSTKEATPENSSTSKEEPQEPSSSDVKEDAKQEEEKEEPLHKNARFKEVISKNRELKEELDDLRKGYEEMQSKFKTFESKEEPRELSIVKELYGDDPNIISRIQQLNNLQREAIKQEIIGEMNKQKEQENKAAKEAKSFIDREMERLEDIYGKINREEVLAVANRFKPIDDNGNVSLEKSYEIAKSMKSAQADKSVEKKKDIQSTPDRGTEIPKKTYVTHKDLRGKDWRSFIGIE